MADQAPMKVFATLLRHATRGRTAGRPRKATTIADLKPLPKTGQQPHPARAPLPALPGLAPNKGKR